MADPKIRSVRDLLASAGNVDLAHALHELTDIVEVLWSEREAERLEREELRAEVADYNQRQRDRLGSQVPMRGYERSLQQARTLP
jgi:hypothetical protein